MTDRERLIELIQVGVACPDDGNPFEEERCASCRYRDDVDCDFLRLADHLLAHGVTFAKDTDVPSKWISVEDRHPDLIPCNAGTAYFEAVNILTSGRKVLIAIWDGNEFIADAEFLGSRGRGNYALDTCASSAAGAAEGGSVCKERRC